MPCNVAEMTEHLSVMDVRDVPFWRRLGAILQAFDRLAPGEVLELVVDLDPWPLHAHLDVTRPGACDWEPIDSGPQTWRVRLRRRC
jgi:uncharacterized protein (DUF2249 family)